jgi:hypothetical protein
VIGDESLAGILVDLAGRWLDPLAGDAAAERRWSVLQSLLDQRYDLRQRRARLREAGSPERPSEGGAEEPAPPDPPPDAP